MYNLKGFSVVTVGLEPGLAALRLLGQVRYSRDPRLGAASNRVPQPVTIHLPLVPGSQPEAWDISLPKLYNVEAMV